MDSDHPTVEFDQLEFRSRAGIAWGFLWRGTLATLASGVLAALCGFILGLIAGVAAPLLGYRGSVERLIAAIRVPSGVIGLAIGLAIFWQYVRWLFRARIGGYRLRLEREV